MGSTSIATRITCKGCGHSILADAEIMNAIDRAMSAGVSARAKMRCTKCRQKNAEIDFSAIGEFYSDSELEEFTSNAASELEYALAAFEFMVTKDKYEPLQPLGFGEND
jgi:predicted nucleic-acid-binding Zn-ribbon protein